MTSSLMLQPFEILVAKGLIAGHRDVSRFGLNPDLGGLESIWDHNGVYVFPPAAIQMEVSSDSASDAAAGTGVRTVLVTGLNANYDEISETVTLNGTTAVLTVALFLRVFNCICLTFGSTGAQVGNIWVGEGVVTAGVPATVYAKVRIGFGQAQMTQYTVPRGYTAYLLEVSAAASATTSNKRTIFSLRVRLFGGGFILGGNAVLVAAPFTLEAAVPRSFVEKTDIDAVADSSDTAVSASASARFLVVRNGSDLL